MSQQQTGRDKVLWAIGILLVVTFALIPVLWIISLSLKPPDQIADGNFFPRSISFANYTGIFDSADFLYALRNSIFIALIATVISIGLAAMAAYAIARLDFPGKSVILSGAIA